MVQERVLVVDDEPMNLFIIEEFLADEGLHLDSHSDPLAAWARLTAPDAAYSLVILDRMMPGLDGIEFLRRMKGEARFAAIPVIMQTAASAPEQVKEGLAAGAFYYLTKPYEPEALISIVRSALADRKSRCEAQWHASHPEGGAVAVPSGVDLRFTTLEDVSRLVPQLAALCPVPETVAPGLSDLMVNAIEHGNLGVTYREKALLKWEGEWEVEIGRRLALPQFRDRYATVRWERQGARIVFTITDQGDGFDWTKYLEFDPDRAFDPNGRGIAMARMMSFSSLEYQGRGNVVVASVALTDG